MDVIDRVEEAAVNYYQRTMNKPKVIYLSIDAAAQFLKELYPRERFSSNTTIPTLNSLRESQYHSTVGTLGFEVIVGDTPKMFVTCDYQDYERYIDDIVAKNILGD